MNPQIRHAQRACEWFDEHGISLAQAESIRAGKAAL